MDEHTTIIGAGPAGLTAAWDLVNKGTQVEIYDENAFVGGLSRTHNFGGYRMDFGGHRFYTKDLKVQKLWEDTLGKDFLLRRRLSRVYYGKKYFHYPLKISNVLRNLRLTESICIAASYLKRKLHPFKKEDNLQEWVSNRFGDRLFQIFFESYTEKVWGRCCSEIGADWASQRIQNLSFFSALFEKWIPRAKRPKSLIEQFHYPRLGPGMMWERLAKKIGGLGGTLQLQTQMVSLIHDGCRIQHIRLSNSKGQWTKPISQIISSVPLKDVVLAMEPAAPKKVIQAALNLKYRGMVVVFLVLRKTTLFDDNWIYVHDPQVRVGRIQNFKNWSPEMVPDPNHTSLGMEYFCDNSEDCWTWSTEKWIELATQEIEILRMARGDEILWGKVVREPKAYPVYDLDYRENIRILKNYLEKFENLSQVGRNGLHRYNNQDHSMLTGMAAANRIQGKRDCVWSVNTEHAFYETQEHSPRKH